MVKKDWRKATVDTTHSQGKESQKRHNLITMLIRTSLSAFVGYD